VALDAVERILAAGLRRAGSCDERTVMSLLGVPQREFCPVVTSRGARPPAIRDP
jgi:hypothetical protein